MGFKEVIENLKVRMVKEKDLNFIYNSFLKSNVHMNKGLVIDEIYFPYAQLALMEVLRNPNVNVWVAHVHNDVDKIVGYVISEMVDDIFILHYVYIKQMYRNYKIATGLLKTAGYEKQGGLVTFLGRPHNRTFIKKFNLSYNPYILMIPRENLKFNEEIEEEINESNQSEEC